MSAAISPASLSRFAGIGVLTTALQYALATILFRLGMEPYALCSGIGFGLSAAAAYVLQARHAFSDRKLSAGRGVGGGDRDGSGGAVGLRSSVRFVVCVAFGLACTVVMIQSLTERGWAEGPAQIVTTGAVFVCNYILAALWVFRKTPR